MNALLDGNRQRWVWSAAGAFGVIALMMLLFRVPEVPSLSTAAPPKPVVRFRPEGALDEEAMMHDPTPLFLPTEHNATVKELPRREPGKTFLDRETSKLTFDAADLNLAKDLPPPVVLNGKPPGQAEPVDALAGDAPAQMPLGFGRTDAAVAPMAPRGGFVEIIAADTGRKVLAEPLPIEARPPTDKDWQPLEFFAAVDAAGLVGPLVLTEGSRVDEVDAYFRTFLAQTFRIGQRLPPGFYRITVGP